MKDDLATVYDALRAMARNRLAAQNARHTLQPTALVHEAWLKLRGHFDPSDPSPAFFKTAAEAMRQILIDHARGKRRLKRGGGEARREPGEAVNIPEVAERTDDSAADFDQVLALNEAVTRLEGLDPQAAGVVKLRFFAGLSVEEAASAMGVSERTVKRDWQFARAWLAKELSAPPP